MNENEKGLRVFCKSEFEIRNWHETKDMCDRSIPENVIHLAFCYRISSIVHSSEIKHKTAL